MRQLKDRTPFIQQPSTQVTDGITLVTHLSVDRLPLLGNVLHAWSGPVAFALYMKASELAEEEQRFREFKRQYMESRSNIQYVIMSSPSYTYPVNILRNNAVRLATTALVMLLDVDFYPSSGLHDYVMQNYAMLSSQASRDLHPIAFVIPAFEQVSDRNVFPRDKTELLRMVEDKTIKPMFEGVDEMPHIYSTRHDLWYKKDRMYEARDHALFEPYVIVAKNRIPPFDERFIYYGNDKIQHALLMKQLGFKFMVVPDHFIVHQIHDVSQWGKDQSKTLSIVQSMLQEQIQRDKPVSKHS